MKVSAIRCVVAVAVSNTGREPGMERSQNFWCLNIYSWPLLFVHLDFSVLGVCAGHEVLTGVIYPVIVRMTWGGGWLGELGFIDFAGNRVSCHVP